MDARDLGRIHSGIDVCDVRGDKVGTVAHVYGHAIPAAGEAGSVATQSREDIVEVKTGLLGLGKHLFIPTRAIEDVNAAGDCVTLNVAKDQLDPSWETKPGYLGDPTG
jgi:hypothetical protein